MPSWIRPTSALDRGIAEFEKQFAAYIGARHAVGISSGTAGLHLAVIAAGVGPGDLVITTPFSFVATANCILYERGIPVFVDIDPLTLNLDPACVTRAVEDLSEGESRQEDGFRPRCVAGVWAAGPAV